jgi:anti-anti-sigma regulatory factor
MATVSQLEGALHSVSGSVVIDCRSLTFIDAAGIGALVRTLEHVRRVRLVNVSPMTRKVLTILDLASTFLDDHPPESRALRARQRAAQRVLCTVDTPPTAQAD